MRAHKIVRERVPTLVDDRPPAPDLAAIVCRPETSDAVRAERYETALSRGAANALIVHYAGEDDGQGGETSAAA